MSEENPYYGAQYPFRCERCGAAELGPIDATLCEDCEDEIDADD